MRLKHIYLLVFLTGIMVAAIVGNAYLMLMSLLYMIVASYLHLFQPRDALSAQRSLMVSPLGIALLALTVYLPLSALPLFLGIKLDDIRPISDDTFSQGVWFFLAGVTAFFTGFQLNLGWVIGQSMSSVPAMRLDEPLSVAVLRRHTQTNLIIGLGSYGLLLLVLGYTSPVDAFLNMVEFRAKSTAQGLSYLTLFVNLTLSVPIGLWVCAWFDSGNELEQGDKQFFLAYLLVYCLVQLTFGARGPFLALMIVAGIAWYLKQGKISIGYVAAAAAGGSALVVFLGLFREALQAPTVEAGWDAATLLNTDGVLFFLANLFARFDSFRRYLEIIEVLSTGESGIDYSYGQPFLALLLSPIPRAILPEKPWLSSAVYTQTFHPQYAANSIYFEISLFGEAYLNFGVAGVVAYCLFVGVLVRALQSYFSDILSKPAKLAFYANTCLLPLGLFQAGICEPVTTGAIFSILYNIWFINRVGSLRSYSAK
jgi:hypothetical protein